MIFILYDYVDVKKRNTIKKWTEDLTTASRAKLNAKLDMLAKTGDDLMPHVLTGTDTPGIYKLRVKGKVQLRPMLCKGPITKNTEFTLLIGAKEVQSKLVPIKADLKANQRKITIEQDNTRRIEHERVR
jgi:hypothetical protein